MASVVLNAFIVYVIVLPGYKYGKDWRFPLLPTRVFLLMLSTSTGHGGRRTRQVIGAGDGEDNGVSDEDGNGVTESGNEPCSNDRSSDQYSSGVEDDRHVANSEEAAADVDYAGQSIVWSAGADEGAAEQGGAGQARRRLGDAWPTGVEEGAAGQGGAGRVGRRHGDVWPAGPEVAAVQGGAGQIGRRQGDVRPAGVEEGAAERGRAGGRRGTGEGVQAQTADPAARERRANQGNRYKEILEAERGYAVVE